MRVLTIALIALCWCLQSTDSMAQLRGFGAPPAPREPARPGLLGGIREAREERFRREAQAAAAAARAAVNPAARNAAAANAAANAAARNPLLADPRSANAAAANNAQQAAAARANEMRAAEARRANLANPYSLNRTAGNLPSSANANRSAVGRNDYAAANGAGASSSAANAARRASNYRGPETYRGPESSDGIDAEPMFDGRLNASNAARQSSAVVAASADRLVPSPEPYDGPGVVIRLPAGSAAPVNYLIDDVENSTIEPGEAQTLGTKGSYVIRYSRGVTAAGKSYGESRYSVTEGQYRFELTQNGWELYREPDPRTAPPPNRVEMAEESSVDALLNRLGRASSSGSRQLPTESLSPMRKVLMC